MRIITYPDFTRVTQFSFFAKMTDYDISSGSSSESETKVFADKAKQKTTSWIWKYFGAISNEKARCNFCK
jgi:hypothetical protein